MILVCSRNIYSVSSYRGAIKSFLIASRFLPYVRDTSCIVIIFCFVNYYSSMGRRRGEKDESCSLIARCRFDRYERRSYDYLFFPPIVHRWFRCKVGRCLYKCLERSFQTDRRHRDSYRTFSHANALKSIVKEKYPTVRFTLGARANASRYADISQRSLYRCQHDVIYSNAHLPAVTTLEWSLMKNRLRFLPY